VVVGTWILTVLIILPFYYGERIITLCVGIDIKFWHYRNSSSEPLSSVEDSLRTTGVGWNYSVSDFLSGN
jgi:hypothetical protein